jgi:hypothetical protein
MQSFLARREGAGVRFRYTLNSRSDAGGEPYLGDQGIAFRSYTPDKQTRAQAREQIEIRLLRELGQFVDAHEIKFSWSVAIDVTRSRQITEGESRDAC